VSDSPFAATSPDDDRPVLRWGLYQKNPQPNRSCCLGGNAGSYAARFPCDEAILLKLLSIERASANLRRSSSVPMTPTQFPQPMVGRLWETVSMGYKDKSRPKGSRPKTNVTAPKVRDMASATRAAKRSFVRAKRFSGWECSGCGWAFPTGNGRMVDREQSPEANAKAAFDQHECKKYPRE
jgi:hypothetical protein